MASKGKVFTLQTLVNTWNLFLIYPPKRYCNTALYQNNSTDDLTQQPKGKPQFTLFLCLRMFRTNAELFGVCIISLCAVSKTVKLGEKCISYKLFQSCVQILFEAFFDPINIPLTLYLLTWRIWWAPNNASKGQMGFNSAFKGLRQKWACLYGKWQSFSTYLTENELAQHMFVNRSSNKFHDKELSDPWAVTWEGESVNRRSSRIRKRLQTPKDLLSRRDWVSESAYPLRHTHVLTGKGHLLKPVAYCVYYQV